MRGADARSESPRRIAEAEAEAAATVQAATLYYILLEVEVAATVQAAILYFTVLYCTVLYCYVTKWGGQTGPHPPR